MRTVIGKGKRERRASTQEDENGDEAKKEGEIGDMRDGKYKGTEYGGEAQEEEEGNKKIMLQERWRSVRKDDNGDGNSNSNVDEDNI